MPTHWLVNVTVKDRFWSIVVWQDAPTAEEAKKEVTDRFNALPLAGVKGSDFVISDPVPYNQYL